MSRGDDAPLTPRQRVVSFASVGDLDDGRRTRPTSPDEPLSNASLARRLINPWPEGSPGMKVKVPRDYVRWDRCRGREPGDDEYVVGEAVNVPGRRGFSFPSTASRRRRGVPAASCGGFLAFSWRAAPVFRGADRADSAAATSMVVRGAGSRRRRGYDVDIPRGQVAATPRRSRPRGRVATPRGAARIVRGSDATSAGPQRRRVVRDQLLRLVHRVDAEVQVFRRALGCFGPRNAASRRADRRARPAVRPAFYSMIPAPPCAATPRSPFARKRDLESARDASTTRRPNFRSRLLDNSTYHGCVSSLSGLRFVDSDI